MSDLRTDLTAALAAFGAQPLPVAARALFATLGYESKRTMRFLSNPAVSLPSENCIFGKKAAMEYLKIKANLSCHLSRKISFKTNYDFR